MLLKRSPVKIKYSVTQYISALFLGCLIFVQSHHSLAAEYLDGIVAVVEDDVILDSELVQEVSTIVSKLKANNVQLPPQKILYQQVLERLVIDKLQSQLAQKSGITVSDEMVNSSLESIAQQNGMSMEEFRTEINNEGMNFNDFRESIRHEILINQLRSQEIGRRIKVSEQEIRHYLETEISAEEQKRKYFLGHILIAVPEAASASEIQAEEAEALSVVKQLRAGGDFKKMAVGVSDGANALAGGELGWRTLNQVPTLFVDVLKTMRKGEISDPIRSPGGFHILKLIDSTGVDSHIITETHVRHILIKTNEIVNDAEAKKRLAVIAGRIADGDDFAALAQANSDDTGSALKGGDLGWVMPGLLVPPFEKAMSELALNELSAPVQTQFGWHLIQVLARRTKDNSEEYKINQARDEIRKRKIEEETELWLRRLRDESYVDIRLGFLNDKK